MLILRRSLFALLGLIVFPVLAHAQMPVTTPVTLSEPVAPSPEGEGTGLCMATAISDTPGADFGVLNNAIYVGSMNSYMESRKDLDGWDERVIRTLFDLSNNRISSIPLSYGDFTDAVTDRPDCQFGGCFFFADDAFNNDTTGFGTRVRGFFNVTPDLVNQPIHFGLYADTGVSLSLFDKEGRVFTPMTAAPFAGTAAWRMTQTVTFEMPGLYPMEILHAEISGDTALELSIFVGDFTDFGRDATVNPVPLGGAGFQLLGPTSFFQTISGAPSLPDLDECRQCNRQYVNQPSGNGCAAGNYCNEAALCAPCDTALFCGPTCSECGGSTPFCVNLNDGPDCVACRDDNDCMPGFKCDPDTHACNECNVDEDCEQGYSCVNNSCEQCNTSDSCAGNSCNCCPDGANGQPMQCTPIDGEGTPPVCVECTSNEQCATGVCDVLIGQCVDKLAENQSPDCCGDGCAKCPADYPFCLPGPFGTACAQCRWDTDCDGGNFCLSGQCMPCTQDKHCGTRCESCGGNTPFCLDDVQVGAQASCVQCNDDADCAGDRCNPDTHQCEPTCSLSCAADTPYCFGDQCVECYADTQCPCGGTCDLEAFSCSSSCKTNTDCQGNEHCRWTEDGKEKECALGPMPSDTACGTTLATACESSVGRGGEHPRGTWLIALATLMLLAWRRRGRS